MKPQTIICLLLLLVFLIQPVATSASETDQYNLPPVPLADIGDEVTDHVADAIRAAVAKVNADIVRSKTCIDIDSPMHSKCDSVGNESRKLTYLRSNEAVAYETYKQLGFGTLLTTKIGGWLTKHKFHGEPAQYKTTYFGSIYLFARSAISLSARL